MYIYTHTIVHHVLKIMSKVKGQLLKLTITVRNRFPLIITFENTFPLVITVGNKFPPPMTTYNSPENPR